MNISVLILHLHVAIPPEKYNVPLLGPELTALAMKDYKIGVSFVEFHGKIWIRFSAGIYSTKEDFYKFRDAVMKILSAYERK